MADIKAAIAAACQDPWYVEKGFTGIGTILKSGEALERHLGASNRHVEKSKLMIGAAFDEVTDLDKLFGESYNTTTEQREG